MSDLNRMVAGLRCHEVLELLADYVDGELDATMFEKVNEHLRGCDRCEKFGGEYGALVTRLRASLRVGRPSEEIRTRLGARLRRIWADEDAR